MWKRTATVTSMTFAMTACIAMTPSLSSAAATKTSVSQVMNWFAEPEQGGQWAAQANGDYTKVGLDMTTAQGGPQVSSIPLVASGKYTFGMGSADSILQARAQGIPIVAVFSAFQIDPQVLIWHSKSKVNGFSDLNGHTVYVSTAAPYWQYLVTKYHLSKTKDMSYTGSLVPFVHDKNSVIQGYETAEPYTLAKEHVKVNYALIADSGFDPYQNMMFTTEKELKEHPDVVAAFVKASQQGWYQYLSDPTSGDHLIVKDSPNYTKAQLLFAVKKEKLLIEGGQAAMHGIGYMTKQRWDTLASQMEKVGMLPKGFSTDGAFTDEFIPKQPMK